MDRGEVKDSVGLKPLYQGSDAREVISDGVDGGAGQQMYQAVCVVVGDGVDVDAFREQLTNELGANVAVAASENGLAKNRTGGRCLR